MDTPAQEREPDQPTAEMSIPDVTVDQPQTRADVPGRNEENVGDVAPSSYGEGMNQETEQKYAVRFLHLITEYTSVAQKSFVDLRSSYEAAIRGKDEYISELRQDYDRLSEIFNKSIDHNKAVRVLLQEQFFKMQERMSECKEELKKEKAERSAVANINFHLTNDVAVLKAELVARESILKETQKELEKCKADKAAADAQFNSDHVKAMKYDELVKREFDNLLDENKYLAGQLAERDAEA